MKEHTLAAQPTREQQWVSANNMQVRAKGLSESLMNSHRGAKRKAVLPKNIQPCFILRGKKLPPSLKNPQPPLTLSPIPERAWRLRPQRLLGEDREPRLCFCLWWTQHKKTRATKNGGVVGNKLGKIGWQFRKNWTFGLPERLVLIGPARSEALGDVAWRFWRVQDSAAEVELRTRSGTCRRT